MICLAKLPYILTIPTDRIMEFALYYGHIIHRENCNKDPHNNKYRFIFYPNLTNDQYIDMISSGFSCVEDLTVSN